ncbi:uncharacterized protein GIQ15_04696 [Arthroderma uncinatum]|uniref:uncharacterized protein n=1 Tax=Arthroderma uncinatum TaxID=74035 RepID=UPI00144A7B5B|nr:uncharacterized protein GIQ15_04696 [Arthroderma uncinatum]KAF3481937.1 hypothetical protein GIQ15_04696 [Arthroderma uncinatum]
MSRVIAVVGATGNQGGSVARSLLQNPSFKVRAITRDPSSKASQALAAAGAEVVQANGFNNEEMLRAFDGAWGFYVNLNSDDKMWSDPNGPTEFDLGKSIVDAAAQAGVQNFVFSSGPPCTEMTGGKVRMKAMDMKNKIEQYAKQLGKFQTIIPINAAWYLENFLVKEVAPVFGGFPHFPDEEGYLTYRVPNWGGDNKVPFLSITDDYVTGKKARFQPILPSWEAFETHGVHELEDVKLMFGFTQITGGRYFGPEPSNIKTSAELKHITATALGRPEGQRELMSSKDWFRSQFA